MATQVQYRRGTTAEHSAFTGAVAEITVDTTKDTLVVHDGVATGGHPLAKESDLTAHISDPTAAHTASAISVLDAGARFTSTDVEGCLAEAYDKASATSLSYFTEGRNITAPNATVPAHYFSSLGAESDIDFVASPKGTGALLAQVPDNTATGGDKRGNYAVDLQMLRGTASQVASGAASVVAGGDSNTATASNSGVGGGDFNSTTAIRAYVGGGSNNLADGAGSVIPGGTYATTRGVAGKYALSYGVFSIRGDRQIGTHVQGATTTDATATILTAGAAAPTTGNVATLPDNHTYSAVAYISARNTTTGDSAVWKIEGAVKRGAGAATTTLIGVPSITTIAKDAGASSWVVSMVANTTRGSVEIQVTGAAATNIHWGCRLDTMEVG